jgi:hypothetical protein
MQMNRQRLSINAWFALVGARLALGGWLGGGFGSRRIWLLDSRLGRWSR